jgi:hypothetical protein
MLRKITHFCETVIFNAMKGVNEKFPFINKSNELVTLSEQIVSIFECASDPG